ncbi:alpha/beta fold hydrolase [Tritonibacter mobilis]|uniref:alpha/beta fold hydrolase n=1 Tax=Tritonibacter mobilis TaxID=379347 RepID=UPI001CDA4A93|nr:alpha/beta fold hydrolase [Tritonibacter mobilis]MCA2007480.1 alpha/beta fold hydrolase [Tritonibacter mobilis]
MLNTILHGTPTDHPPLLIAHGLYGSGRNWGVIAKRLSDERQVIAVDMRNHGLSPQTQSHTYVDLAEDLAEVIATHGGRMDVVGHSMGGKAAMVLALNHPEAVNRLVVADIAPVSYQHTQAHFITAMRSVDLSRVTRRSDAQEQLAEAGVDAMLQSFFTQSLDVEKKCWRLNLDTLEREMPHILSFPEIETHWDGATLFLTGANSEYVLAEHRGRIKSLFPGARFAKIPGAGHWLHAEKPREFEATVRSFLNA